LKYRPGLPGRAASIEAAWLHRKSFFARYNNENRHTGLGLHTAADVHSGLAEAIRDEHADILAEAYAALRNGSCARRPCRRNRRPTA